MKKVFNSILMVALIVIWTAVFYRFYGVKGNIEPTVEVTEPIKEVLKRGQQIENYINFSEIAHDPFLDVLNKDKEVVLNTSVESPNKRNILSQAINKNMIWPEIRYYGFVKRNSSKKRLAIIRLDGLIYKVRKSEYIKGEVKLTYVWPDSIEVQINSLKKYFKKY